MGGTTSAVTVRAPKARHGRHEVRLLWALHDPFVNRHAGAHGVTRAPWPGLQQVARVERRRTVRRRGQARCGAPPQVMATCRNLALALVLPIRP